MAAEFLRLKKGNFKVISLFLKPNDYMEALYAAFCYLYALPVLNQEIAKMVWTNQWEPHAKKGIRFPWKFWSKGAGIIGCQNKESEVFLMELTKTIKWPGKTF